MAGKPALSVEQQIEHLENKGITFEQCSRDDAANYLREKCNYFKLASYRKLFAKYVGGRNDERYISLDFGQLRFLAELDQQLCALLLQMTHGIEHFQKVALLAQMEKRGEDGYQIVANYMSSLTSSSKTYRLRELERSARSPYSRELYEKYREHMPAWVFFELTSFGTLIGFVRFCGIRWDDKELKRKHYDLKSVKSLRNCAAHGSCIINQFASRDGKVPVISNDVIKAVKKMGCSKATRSKWLRCQATRGIAITLATYGLIAPHGTSRTKMAKGLGDLFERVESDRGMLPHSGPGSTAWAAFQFLNGLTDVLRLLDSNQM